MDVVSLKQRTNPLLAVTHIRAQDCLPFLQGVAGRTGLSVAIAIADQPAHRPPITMARGDPLEPSRQRRPAGRS